MRVWLPLRPITWRHPDNHNSFLVLPGETAQLVGSPDTTFGELYFCVHSFGFLIELLKIGNQEVLKNVSGDLFHTEKIDAEEEKSPSRCMLEGYEVNVGNLVFAEVMNWGVEPKEFHATLYGKGPKSRW